MGKRHKRTFGGQRSGKAVPISMAGDAGSDANGDGTLSMSEAFDAQWGPSGRFGRHALPSVQPPQRFRSSVEALGAYELIPLVYACVQTIAINGAMLPLVIRRNGEVLPANRPSKIRDLLTRPNPLMSRFELLEATFTYLELCGNAYYLKDEQDGYGRPRKLWPLYAALMSPDIDADSGLIAYDYALATGVRFAIEDILHIKNFRPDNFYEGLGTAQAGARALEEADNTAAWSASFFRNGATIAGVLQTDNRAVSPIEQQRILREWREIASGVENAYKTLILTSGLKYQQIGVNPGDLGLKDLRGITRDEILMLFRMPPTKVGLYDHANYKAEQADRDFWEQCMRPRVLRVQAKLQELADLFGDGDEVILDIPQFKDKKLLADIAASLAGNKHVTRNEVREVLDLPPDANGDTFRVGLNEVEEPFTPLPNNIAPKTGGKAVSALHQEALTTSAQRDKIEAEQLAAKTLATAMQRFFDQQEARITAMIESTMKAAGGTRAFYDQKRISELWSRRSENTALYAVGRLLHTFAGERAATWLKAATGVQATWAPDDPIAAAILKQLGQRDEFKAINETTRQAIAQALDLAEQRKYSARQLIDGMPSEGFTGINGIFDEARGSRTQTIIRTETALAWNRSMVELGRAYGLTKFVLSDGDHDGAGSVGPDGLSCAERNGLIVDAEAAANHCRGSHPNCTVSATPYYGDRAVGERI